MWRSVKFYLVGIQKSDENQWVEVTRKQTNNKELIIRTEMNFSRSSQFSVIRLRHLNRSEMTTCLGCKKGCLGWNCTFDYVSPLFQF